MRFSSHNKKITQGALLQAAIAFLLWGLTYLAYRLNTHVPNSTVGFPSILLVGLGLMCLGLTAAAGWWWVSLRSPTGEKTFVFAGGGSTGTSVTPVSSPQSPDTVEDLRKIAEKFIQESEKDIHKNLDEWEGN